MKSGRDRARGGLTGIIRGRITRLHRLGRRLAFADVDDQGQLTSLVLEGDFPDVRRGDLVTAAGEWTRSRELRVARIDVHGRITDLRRPSAPAARLLDPRRLEALRIRSAAIAALHRFFHETDFVPVDSPTIVSDWVRGQTGAFNLDFYDEDAFLKISNMPYHQVLLTGGFSRIYEIGKLFRREHPSSIHRLAEFTILDVSWTGARLDDLMTFFEGVVRATIDALSPRRMTLVEDIRFDRVTVRELLDAASIERTTGAQLPAPVRRHLERTHSSFVWVTGFPARTRPFYVRASSYDRDGADATCADCQLWFRGRTFLAAGGEVESDRAVLEARIRDEGKDPRPYAFLLDAVELGLHDAVGIGMGVERFLANVLTPSTVADFTLCPRYRGHVTP